MLAKVGTKSITSTFYEMLQKPMAVCNYSNAESQLQIEEEEPYYLQLWMIQRKKKDGTWSDELAEKAYKDLQELHQKRLDEYGVDNLTPQEAFSRVLKHREGSHHQRGIGQGVLSFSTYQKKVIPEIDIQERIDTEVNRRVAQIHESYEACLRALEERLGPSNAQVQSSGSSQHLSSSSWSLVVVDKTREAFYYKNDVG